MKRILLAALFLTVAGIVRASAQSQTYTAPVNSRERAQRRAPVTSSARAVGAFPRTARNPIQLINPRAPQRYYGPPQETIVYDPVSYEANRHPRVTGLILFGLVW